VPHEDFCAIRNLLQTRFGKIFPVESISGIKIRRSILLGHQIEDDQWHAEVAQFFPSRPALGEPPYLNEL